MDYEQKYNEALEKARELYNDAKANEYKSDMEDYESIFPELAESEDERIRKKMIEHFKSKTKDTWCNMPVKSILAWLEKQKEYVSNNFDDVWDEEDCEEIIAEGQKLTPRFKELLKEVCHAWYDRGAKLEKQKEQKPAEWSEEDEKDMAHIIRILDDCYVYGTHDLSKTDYENLVNKLKSLRPQYHGDVTMTEAYKMGLEAGKASSWKPSEEDLMMLEHIIGQYEIGNKNSKVMGYLPRIEELDFLKKVLAKWKN